MELFNTLLIHPMINGLVVIYQSLVWLHVPFALGFSIIIFTAAIRLLISPLMKGMLVQQKKMQEINPQLAKIKEKYKGDSRKQQAAQMELFKANGINPAAGCLPLLVQFPLFIALYQSLLKIVNLHSVKDLNHLLYSGVPHLGRMWDTSFFGLPIGASPSTLLPKLGFAILLISIVTGALQLVQSKMMAPSAAKAKDKPKTDDFAVTLQKQMLFMVPVMIGFFSFTFPIGITLYWNTFTIFGIIQQYKMQGWGGLGDWILIAKGRMGK